MKRGEAMKTRAILETAVQTLPDKTALEVPTFYPAFDELCKIKFKADKKGFKFRNGDKLYKTRQEVCEFLSHYPPGVGMESMYEAIDDEHAGTLDDPKHYNGNMELFEGVYYEQFGSVYLCISDTLIPVVHPLRELVGHYVTLIKEG